MASLSIPQSKLVNKPALTLGNISRRLLIYLFLGALALFFIFPFYAMLIASFMERNALNSITPHLWPDPFITGNYVSLFTGIVGDDIQIKTSFVRALFNSMALAVGQTV